MRGWYRKLCAINYPTVLVCFWLSGSVALTLAIIALALGFKTIALLMVLLALILISLPDDIGSPFVD
jgi:hypothetical protein